MMRRVPIAALGLALAVFAVDQWLKYWVTGVLDLDALGGTRQVAGFFRITFLANCGISLGMFRVLSDTLWVRIMLTLATSGIALAVMVWLWRERSPVDRLALGAIFGGAAGNIADRAVPAPLFDKITSGAVRYPGCVIDFADLHIGEWRPFLVFNVADVAITIGVLVLLATNIDFQFLGIWRQWVRKTWNRLVANH